MRPIRELKNLVLRMKALPGSAAFRNACKAGEFGPYRRLYHYHIRKTAGTSLNQALLSIGGEPGDVVYQRLIDDPNHRTLSGQRAFVGWSWGLIEQGHYHFAFSHYAAHQLRLPPNTFTIVCLRDPVQRLVSYYSMLCEMRSANSSHGALKLARPWLGKSLHDFLASAPRSFLSMQLYMFSDRFDVSEAIDRTLRCDCVLFTQEYADGLRELGRLLNLSLPLLHVRPAQNKPVLSESELSAARDALKDEYAMIEAVHRVKCGSRN